MVTLSIMDAFVNVLIHMHHDDCSWDIFKMPAWAPYDKWCRPLDHACCKLTISTSVLIGPSWTVP